MFLRYYLIVLSLGLGSLLAQDYYSPWDRDKNAFVVKQYDEFIERFNFDQETPVVAYMRERYGDYELDREMLLRSLFDIEQSWDEDQIDRFVAQVDAPQAPVSLDFFDSNWYAEVKVTFEYYRKEYEGSLILKNVRTDENASKWQIISVIADFLPQEGPLDPAPRVYDPTRILSPMSHASDFAALHRIFKDPPTVSNFFSNEQWSPQLSRFLREVRKGNLCLDATHGVVYHLLQIEGWIVTLRDFNRNLPNAGILISSIDEADVSAKAAYRQTRLNMR